MDLSRPDIRKNDLLSLYSKYLRLKRNELEVTQWEETPRKSLKKQGFSSFSPLI